MSYSIGARGATKEETLASLGAELDLVVADQPVHLIDRLQAAAAAASSLDVISVIDPAKDYVVNISADLVWNGDLDNRLVSSARLSAHAALVEK